MFDGCWLLVVGCWLLVVGRWSLVEGIRPPPIMELIKIVSSVLAAAAAGMFAFAVLRQIAWNRAHEQVTELELLRRGGRRSPFEGEWSGVVLLPFVFVARALPTPNLRERIAEKLVRAGNPNFYSPDEQIAICCATACLIATIGGVLTFLDAQLRFGPNVFLGVSAGLVVGFYLPIWLLTADGTRRLRMITKSLPYALDLISLTMSAGATFTDSVKTLIRNRTGDPLADEFRRLLAEIDFGTPRPAALAKMAERVPTDDMRNIVASINQAETYGSSLSEILKAQAGLMRLKRSVAAEKAAAEASVKLLLPMTMILVAVLLLVFAPAVIRWKMGSLL
jgi:tight adherence protein C